MSRPLITIAAAGLVAALVAPSIAPAQGLIYRERTRYPVLEEIEAARKARQAERDSLIDAADARAAAERKDRREQRRELRLDWSQIHVPSGPDAFASAWHQPPVPQYYTGSCWAFCSLSFLESEVKRLHGRELKLSEMWIVYWEYVEKARRYIREYGHSELSEGSQDHGTVEVCRLHGVVPQAAYTGVLGEDGRHDHTPLMRELKSYLEWVKASKTWDEERNLAYVRAILDRHMGRPPAEFSYQGRAFTPHDFFAEVCQLDLDAYVNCVSRLDTAFGQFVLLDVPDNWRRKNEYLNLPLDVWYEAIRASIQAGYTISIGGDNSEPGMDGLFDAGVIPEWDIPSQYIDQRARELRIDNRTTGDDHGVHLVGFVEHEGRDWFLLKDSNRSSRKGEHEGYYMWDGDYIKLKMLSFLVHRDRLQGLLPEG